MIDTLEKAQVIGTRECESCGSTIEIKVTKHGGLFGQCWAVIEPDFKGHSKYCRHKIQYSPHYASKVINEFINSNGGKENAGITETETEGNREEIYNSEAGDDGKAIQGEHGEPDAPAGSETRGRTIFEKLFGDDE